MRGTGNSFKRLCEICFQIKCIDFYLIAEKIYNYLIETAEAYQ